MPGGGHGHRPRGGVCSAGDAENPVAFCSLMWHREPDHHTSQKTQRSRWQIQELAGGVPYLVVGKIRQKVLKNK